MYDYFQGKVTEVTKDAIVFEVNNIGYRIAVAKPFKFQIGDEQKLFVEDIFREEGFFLVGFFSREERDVYHGLNTVNGIGPKSALRILGDCDYQELKKAIEANNIFFLRSIKGIGNKASAQILLDLRGYFDLNQNINVNQYEEVQSALRGLGYKIREIVATLSTINIPNASNEEIIREALRRIRGHAQLSRK